MSKNIWGNFWMDRSSGVSPYCSSNLWYILHLLPVELRIPKSLYTLTLLTGKGVAYFISLVIQALILNMKLQTLVRFCLNRGICMDEPSSLLWHVTCL